MEPLWRGDVEADGAWKATSFLSAAKREAELEASLERLGSLLADVQGRDVARQQQEQQQHQQSASAAAAPGAAVANAPAPRLAAAPPQQGGNGGALPHWGDLRRPPPAQHRPQGNSPERSSPAVVRCPSRDP